MCPATKGNRFWKARSTHGRKPTFTKPHILWNACVEYFNWIEDNPLKEEKLFHYQGTVTSCEVSKMRAMTISGLCIYIDVCPTTWGKYRKNKDLMDVTTRADEIIYNQKFTGAAAELLNPNIIARDLKLRDTDDNPRDTENVEPLEIIYTVAEPKKEITVTNAKS